MAVEKRRLKITSTKDANPRPISKTNPPETLNPASIDPIRKVIINQLLLLNLKKYKILSKKAGNKLWEIACGGLPNIVFCWAAQKIVSPPKIVPLLKELGIYPKLPTK